VTALFPWGNVDILQYDCEAKSCKDRAFMQYVHIFVHTYMASSIKLCWPLRMLCEFEEPQHLHWRDAGEGERYPGTR
jgi:hypothetical protein